MGDSELCVRFGDVHLDKMQVSETCKLYISLSILKWSYGLPYLERSSALYSYFISVETSVHSAVTESIKRVCIHYMR